MLGVIGLAVAYDLNPLLFMDTIVLGLPLGQALALNQLDLVQRLRAVPSTVCPLLVVHGTRDGVIPVRQAKALGEALGNRAKLKVFSALTHLDLLLTPAVIETIVGWVNKQLALTRSS